MSLHPRIEELREFAEGGGRRARLASHLAGCTACRESVAWIREVKSAVRSDAPPAPAGAWDRIAARLDAGEVVLLPVESAGGARPGASLGSGLVRAAVLVLALAGAGWAVMSGSAVRSWAARVVERLGEPDANGAAPPATPDSAAAPSEPPATALLIAPRDGAVRISIEAPGTGLVLRVRLDATAAGEVEVRAAGGAAAARFRSGPGRLAVSEAGAGELLVALPQAIGSASIVVDGRPYVEKRGAELRIHAPVADTAGAEIVLPVRR